MAPSAEQPTRQEAYIHDYDGALTEQIVAGRTAETHAAFFLPYLRTGMSLLDCGCGPGTITLGLAQATSPGHVTGIDLEESQVEAARANAAALGLDNVAFDCGDVYRLPYPDESFDALFSHAMLGHMHDPAAVLREMHRVVKPGGVAGLRCVDLGATLMSPPDATLTAAHEIWAKHGQHCGGDPFIGRRLRALLREAGFAKTVGTASCETWGTPQLARSFMTVLLDELTGPRIAETAIQEGWADQAQMNETARALEAWGNDPDAFMAIVWCEAVGWKE